MVEGARLVVFRRPPNFDNKFDSLGRSEFAQTMRTHGGVDDEYARRTRIPHRTKLAGVHWPHASRIMGCTRVRFLRARICSLLYGLDSGMESESAWIELRPSHAYSFSPAAWHRSERR